MDTTELIATGTHLPIMESFYTLQGEGFHQGKAAWFIRLAGCDVGCVWCDVKESWNEDEHPVRSVDELVAEACQQPGRIAVITGGEPTLYPLGPLTEALKKEGFATHIETSGAHPLTGTWDWVCLSPKKFKPPLDDIFQHTDELKVIVFNKSDFDWAEKYAALVPEKCKLYLQPEWSKREVMIPKIVDYIQNNPKWELSMQIHKYIGVP